MKKIFPVIMAAGQGKRMKSALPKVLHCVGGKTLLHHVVQKALRLSKQQIFIVVPQDHQLIQDSLQKSLGNSYNRLIFAVQHPAQGTGDALRCALQYIPNTEGDLILLNADMPLLGVSTMKRILSAHQQKKAQLTILTAHLSDPPAYGRVIRDQQKNIVGIVEEKDATTQQKKINEVNVGVYAMQLDFAKKAVKALRSNNAQKEYYVTDLVALVAKNKKTLASWSLVDLSETLGVNSQSDLYQINQLFYQRQRERFLTEGVCLIGSEIFIDDDVSLAQGIKIESPCYLKGKTKLGKNVVVETGCMISASTVGENSVLHAHSYLDQVVVNADCQIGPFAHLRPQTFLADHVKIGNFVEIKKTDVGSGSKVNHLSYIGDAVLGKRVNVGAGTITCNYDGYQKSKTILEDGVFVGSDTQLVAPVRVGKNAVIGAGTTVTKEVSAESLVISRIPQKEIPQWAAKKRQKNELKK